MERFLHLLTVLRQTCTSFSAINFYFFQSVLSSLIASPKNCLCMYVCVCLNEWDYTRFRRSARKNVESFLASHNCETERLMSIMVPKAIQSVCHVYACTPSAIIRKSEIRISLSLSKLDKNQSCENKLSVLYHVYTLETKPNGSQMLRRARFA